MSRRRELVRVGRSDLVPTPYQCLICQGPTGLKGGGLCFSCGMEVGGNAISELWCTRCDEKMAACAAGLPR